MNRTYKEYTSGDIITIAKGVKSIAGLIKGLNLKPVGGNYYTIKKHLKELNIDTRHWTGQGWNKNEQLKDWSQYKRIAHLKKHLIKIRGRRCQICKRKTWMKKILPLEVHHLDFNKTNNSYENILLVCPNCHSQEHNKI